MEDEKIPKKVYQEKIFGTRPQRKTEEEMEGRGQWMRIVDSVSLLGIRDWRTRA